MDDKDAAATVMGLATAYWASRCLHLAADLGVADVLGDEPQSAEALAERLGGEVKAGPLGRVLRCLASNGVFTITDDGSGFAHNAASRLLRTGRQPSLNGLARMMGLKFHWAAYGDLDVVLRTGAPSGGDIFARFDTHPEEGRIFDEAMTGKSISQVGPAAAAYDFTGFEVIGDIGGGAGHLLRAVLDAAPGAKGALFDLPHVVARAEEHPDPRIRYHGGDFFKDPLPACDLYLMMTVLHDWSDEAATAILSAVRRAARPGAKLLVIEGVVEPGRRGDFVADLDIEMLVMTTGKERSRAEWEALVAGAGMDILSIRPIGPSSSIIEVAVG